MKPLFRVVLLALLIFAGRGCVDAYAAISCPDLELSTATSFGGTALITPARTGPALADVGGTVTLTLYSTGGLPIPHYPFQDIWLDDPGDGSISLCEGGSTANQNSDLDGITYISGALAGGGYSANTQVYICGAPLAAPLLSLALNSPDINGDLVVDVTDFATFGLDFGSTQFRSDLVPDGVVDISDFAAFGSRFGESCP